MVKPLCSDLRVSKTNYEDVRKYKKITVNYVNMPIQYSAIFKAL